MRPYGVEWLPENLRMAMEQAEMSAEGVAESMGVNTSTVMAWLAGTRTPVIYTLGDLCELLGCTPNDLLEGE